jgi:hypothetical protein
MSSLRLERGRFSCQQPTLLHELPLLNWTPSLRIGLLSLLYNMGRDAALFLVIGTCRNGGIHEGGRVVEVGETDQGGERQWPFSFSQTRYSSWGVSANMHGQNKGRNQHPVLEPLYPYMTAIVLCVLLFTILGYTSTLTVHCLHPYCEEVLCITNILSNYIYKIH